jgi:hypothetical protein
MNTPNPVTPRGAPDAYDAASPAEKFEADASVAALAAGEALRAVEVAAVVLLGLLICPPLAILAVVVVVPLLVTALILGLIAAVLTAPYLLVHHLRSPDRRHTALLAHRLRHAGSALVDVLPHRIVADANKLHHAGR